MNTFAGLVLALTGAIVVVLAFSQPRERLTTPRWLRLGRPVLLAGAGVALVAFGAQLADPGECIGFLVR